MSDNGPENLTLRYLRSMDERLGRLEDGVTRGFEVMAARFAALETRFLALETRISAIEAWSADTTRRLDRIERRLGLLETTD